MVVGLPAKVLAAIKAARVVGVLRADSSQSAIKASLASVAGGLRVVELTFTTPNVTEAIEHLKNVLPDNVLLGAGTVLSLEQAKVLNDKLLHVLGDIDTFWLRWHGALERRGLVL